MFCPECAPETLGANMTKHVKTNQRIPNDFKLTQEFLLELFDYKDGNLYWKPEMAGTIDGSGYIQTGIKGKYFKNHRLIFLMHHGHLPDLIDHIDGNRLNNRIENLRAATRSQNSFNSRAPKSSKTGEKGVSWRSDMKKWRARVYEHRTMHHLGYFDDFDEAVKAVREKRKLLHKEFARNN
jgi:hypothetical protein